MTIRDESEFRESDTDAPLVGVLALQGDFREHARMLASLGASVRLVRLAADLDGLAGIVLPGGESSAMDKLARTFGVFEPLRAAIAQGLPAYGTCAGMILLADRIEDAAPGQQTLGGLDVTVQRNAFGAQNQSFETDLIIPELGQNPVHATFIRGPVVSAVGAKAKAIATLADGRVVAVEQESILATAFHPEMNDEPRFHERFLDKARVYLSQRSS